MKSSSQQQLVRTQKLTLPAPGAPSTFQRPAMFGRTPAAAIPLATVAPNGEVVVIKVEDGGAAAQVVRFHGDGEEEDHCMDMLMSAVHRRKLQIKARRVPSTGATAPPLPLPPPPPATVRQLPAPAHCAWPKRPATTEAPSGLAGVRHPPQKQHQHQQPPPWQRAQHAPPSLPSGHHAPTAAGTTPPAHRALTTGPPLRGFSGGRQPPQKQQQQQQQQKHQAQPWQRVLHTLQPAPNAHRALAETPPSPPQPVNVAHHPWRRSAGSKPASSSSSLAAELRNPTVPCVVCGVLCMSARHLRQHEKGRKHRNKVGYTAGEMNVRCEVCNVTLLSKLNVAQHYAGKNHRRRLRER